ncbi:MAG: 3-oxoacyl-ACP reductase FabG [Gammaproteobacteria bacterium]|jgi:3-oxoacyl-[acyl-carrier protein] reductase|nr:3-oxoacyl-ACP reductase FabG [Gammaproteobacteria bacterium]MBT3723156.1 3-oxoacyl-ACP reductase FabG [Gammaproteobacteria bacterium]MBT4075003.1 3-oxoacyl-ACP reductase FabG [Gammaproteobacteria bacterium]MBT4196180.1 3-oxoacyl-ACP reductase FabG [Gammaproteobacteria bacterium]MBT4448307.1 3-oxoacyl-ACP reductase FabG [Gammaproteobacteria bacterium]
MLTDQIALVTGASRGIGKAIARGLGEAGATVIGTATSQGGADNITTYLSDAGIKGKGLMLDVANTESIAACLKQITDEFGTTDILINNAGITKDGLLMAMKEDQWDSIINTNLSSIFRMSKAVVRGMMKKRTGRIISISSVVGASGNPGQTNYAAAKAGLVGFSKSLAREIGSRNVTVNAVAPGFIDTDMTKELGDKQKDALLSQIPLGRLGSAEEIAATVVFLASPAAAYITGETIHVNGGMYMA